MNIIEARHVILVEPILNPATELQAIGRVHRIGQTKETVVHRFLVRETIEERMHHILRHHHDTFHTDENTVTIEDLKKLFLHPEELELQRDLAMNVNQRNNTDRVTGDRDQCSGTQEPQRHEDIDFVHHRNKHLVDKHQNIELPRNDQALSQPSITNVSQLPTGNVLDPSTSSLSQSYTSDVSELFSRNLLNPSTSNIHHSISNLSQPSTSNVSQPSTCVVSQLSTNSVSQSSVSNASQQSTSSLSQPSTSNVS